LATWGAIGQLRGWDAFRHARREAGREGPRDAISGTALADDSTLVEELEAVRASSMVRGRAYPAAPAAIRRRQGCVLGTWVALIVLFLVIWQVLAPNEKRPRALTDDDCRARSECKAWGTCKARGSLCVAGSDEDCAQSDACRKLGQCQEVDGECYGRAEPARPSRH
jgi:hypothetical protein